MRWRTKIARNINRTTLNLAFKLRIHKIRERDLIPKIDSWACWEGGGVPAVSSVQGWASSKNRVIRVCEFIERAGVGCVQESLGRSPNKAKWRNQCLKWSDLVVAVNFDWEIGLYQGLAICNHKIGVSDSGFER